MLDFSKVTIFFCLFFQLFSTASAALPADWHDYIPTREHLLKAERWILEHSSRETRLFLHANIPTLFPVNILCQLRDGTVKKALLPGDPFQAQSDQAEIECKNFLKLTLHKGSAGTIADDNGIPQISLTAGGADLLTQGKPVAIHFPDFDLRIRSSDPSTRFAIRQNDQRSLIFCNRGLAEGQLIAPPAGDANEKYIGAHNCRLILTDGITTKKYYVFQEEFFHPADIGVVGRQSNAFSDVAKFFPPQSSVYVREIHTSISFPAASARQGPLTLLLNRGARPVPANCTLYTQASPESPLAAAYQFKLAGENDSSVKLHPDYRKYYLSVVCSESGGLSVSNRLSPQ